MDSQKIISFFQEHWYFVTLPFGILIFLGAIMNRNRLCDPAGKPDSHRYGRGSRRVIFFFLGIVLITVSIWNITR